MGGGKAAQTKTNQMIQSGSSTNIGEHQEDRNFYTTGRETAQENATGSREDLTGSIRDFGNTDYSQAAPGKLNAADYNVDPFGFQSNYNPDYAQSTAAYTPFLSGGGVDENKMRVAQPIFQDIASNQDIANRYRANGTYQEFANTGGFSDADRANIRARTASQIPAYYKSMQDQADRLSAVQGGAGPGSLALRARLARDQATQSAGAVRDTEIGLQQAINAGRQWGAQGMTGAEGAYQGARLGAGNALDTSEANIQGTLQRGRMFGATGIGSIDQQRNQILAAQSLANSAQAADIATGNAQRRVGVDTGNVDRQTQVDSANAARKYAQGAGVVGAYQDLNADDRAALGTYVSAGNQAQGQYTGADLGYINANIQNNPRRDWLGTVLGAAGPIIGGVAGTGGIRG